MFFKTSLGQESCRGDSGGPLVYRTEYEKPLYQIGVVSFGSGSKCGGENKPGFYTKVKNFLPWIESKLDEKLDI